MKPARQDPAFALSQGPRCREVAFAEDSTLREGASPEAYWRDLEPEEGAWVLYLVNEQGRVARMRRTFEGEWKGRWPKRPGYHPGLKRVKHAFPFRKRVRGFLHRRLRLKKRNRRVWQTTRMGSSLSEDDVFPRYQRAG